MSLKFLEATGVQFTSPGGGSVAIPEGRSVRTVGPIDSTARGTSFGPLELRAYGGSTVVVDDLSFHAVEDVGLFSGIRDLIPLIGVFGISTAHEETGNNGKGDNQDTDATRREVLKAGAVVFLAPGVLMGKSSADAEKVTVSEMAIRENPLGMEVRVMDSVDSVLPQGCTFYVRQNGEIFDSFEPHDSETALLPPGETGDFSIEMESQVGFLDRLVALFGDETIDWPRQLDQPASGYTSGEEVVISGDPMLVSTVRDSGPEDTIISIGGAIVPHQSRTGSDAGYWYIGSLGEDLVYVVGEDPPDSSKAEISVYIGTVEKIRSNVGVI